jgi:PKD repeat protein
MFGQTDTEFWFVVPELSHRNNTGGTPGTLRISTLELEATVTISMPANPYDAVSNPNGFQDIVLTIPANSASAVDLTHLIDTDALPNNNRLENKPLTPQGINNFGLHITATNVINTYWEVNYQWGSDLWTLKGSNGLGTLFYTPFQTIYPNNNILPARAYSAIDVVATEDNTRITFQLPAGKAASYGLNAANTIPAGGTYTTPPLRKGQTFSIYPFRYSTLGADRLSGTRVSSNAPIAVSVKDDAILTPPSGQTTVGDQIVPVSIAGENYIVPEVQNPNHVYILATADNTHVEVFIADGTNILSTVLNEGEQIMAMIPNGAKFARITSRVNTGDPFKPIYVWQVVGTGNQNRGGALVPPIGCTGNTQLAFTRAREGENGFYFYVITEKQNMDKFLVDGEKRDDLIPPVMENRGFTELAGSGGWVAQLTSSINANVLATGQHLIENTGGIFHLGIINGFPSAQRGALFYGYYSDFGGLNVGATVAGTNSSVVRSCFGDPVPLHAFGGTSYQWTPDTYLSDASSSTPMAIDLPTGPHDFTVEVSGACGSGEIDLTIVVTPPVEAYFETNVNSGCSPLEITLEDQSSGAIEWLYDLGDGSPPLRYDSITSNDPIGNAWPLPPDPFTFTHTYTNTTDSIIEFEISLLTKNISGCDSTYGKTITVFPEVHSAFELDRSEGCGPLEVQFTNNSWGHIEIYLWDFGDGNTSTSSDSILSHTFQNNTPFPVTYMVTLRAGNAEGCFQEVQHTVTVYPEVVANFSTNIQEACSPAEFLFQNNSTGASTYSWDFGDGGSSNDQHPIHMYDRNMRTNDTVFRVALVSVSNELCRDSAFFDVVLHPYIEAVFTTGSETGCHPFSLTINNESMGVDAYEWDFGDGSPVSNETASTLHHVYLNSGSSRVEYPLQLTVFNEEGCSDTLVRKITVNPEISANFTTDQWEGCHPLTVNFTDLSVNAVSYHWDFGDGTSSQENSPAHTYTNFGTSDTVYMTSLTTSTADGACVKSISWPIKVAPQVLAQFTVPDTPVCNPGDVIFENLSTGGTSFTWDFGDGTDTSTNNLEPLSHLFFNSSFNDSKTYEVTMRAENAYGCSGEMVQTVTVLPDISSGFTRSVMEGCVPLQVDFANTSQGAHSYLWEFGDGERSELAHPVHIFTNPSSTETRVYDVKLISIGTGSCRDSSIHSVSVSPHIEANFDMDTAVCHLSDVSITNTSMGADSFTWDFGDGSPVSRSSDPELDHYYLNVTNSPINYTVVLRVENEEGCMHQMQKNVLVYPESEGGILNGSASKITFGSSTGPVLLTGHTGEVLKWQKIVKAGPWVDIAHTDTQYSEIPASADLWQYRAVVQSGACEEIASDLFSIFVDPKELVITPAPEQTKREGDPDPVLTFTNSEWADNTNFTGTLMRESGEAPGEYAYLLGDLSAGSNYTLAMNPDATKFTITSTVGYEEFQDNKDLSLFSYSNPFQESTVLAYALPFDGRVTLTIRNMAGQVVHTLVNNKAEKKGDYSIVFGDSEQEAGFYFATLMLEGDKELVTCTLKLIKSR